MQKTTLFIVLVAIVLHLEGSEDVHSKLNSQTLLELTIEELLSTKTTMVQEPADAKADIGETVDFLCEFSEIPAYCAWTHDGHIFAPSPGGHITSIGGWPADADCSIRINTITMEDTGGYQCTFPETSPGSGVESRVAKLTVLHMPQDPEIIGHNLGDEIILQGNNNKLTCTAKDGNPEASLIWLIDDHEIEGVNSVVSGTTAPLLTAVSEVTISANQEYDYKKMFCYADHETYADPRQTNVVLRVAKPVTTAKASFEGTSDTNATFPAGSNVKMTCIADGFPSPDYTWLKENQTTFDWLIIDTKQNISDIAEKCRYLCAAKNSENPTVVFSNILTLTVSDYITVIEQPKNSTARLGEDLELNCTFSGGVELCNWYKDGTLLSPGNNDYIFNGDESVGNCNIVIPNIQIKQDGIYFCEAFQVESDDATVTVLQAPKSPVLIYNENEVPENSIIHEAFGTWPISCKAEDGHPVAEIVWKLNHVDEEGTDVVVANAENPLLETITSTVQVELTTSQPSITVICRSLHLAYPIPGYKSTTVTFESSGSEKQA